MAAPVQPRGMTLLELKMRAKAKEDEEKIKAARKKSALILIQDFLAKQGYVEALERLQTESNVSIQKWVPADNMDLFTVLQEYEDYYQMKYSRQPKFVRGATADDEVDKAIKSRKNRTSLPTLPSHVGAPTALPAQYRPAASGTDNEYSYGSNTGGNENNSNVGNVNNNNNNIGDKKDDNSRKPGIPRSDKPRVGSQKNKSQRNISSAEHASSYGSIDISIQGFTAADSTNGASKRPGPTNKTTNNTNNSINSGVQSETHSRAHSTDGRRSTHNNINSSNNNSNNVNTSNNNPDGGDNTDNLEFHENKVLKPLPNWTGQYRELAEIITRDIYSENPNVRWSDIVELDEAKQLLKEAVIMPMKYPQFFTGLLSPWKGILLYGPPGTGKTMLARAVATECRTTFFNVSASSIVSKWRGDSEKLVRVLFELARYHAPSTIFIDELDSIMGSRDTAGEHEGSRRMKTELLIQMDGLAKSSDLVFVLAASNLPWDLDMAILRRLEKRILVPLPNEKARAAILRKYLPENERAVGLDYITLGKKTEGYSGADIVSLCKEAAMRPVRRLMTKLSVIQDENTQVNSEVVLDPVSSDDMSAALTCTRPSAAVKFLQKYADWHGEYGAGYSDHYVDNPPIQKNIQRG